MSDENDGLDQFKPSFFARAKVRFRSIWRDFPKSWQELTAWYWLSWGVLYLLTFGIIWLVIWRNSSAGGLLVGTAIVAQALLQILPLGTGRKSRDQIITEAANPGVDVRIFVNYDLFKAYEKLEILTSDSDREIAAKPQFKNARALLRDLTISRVYSSLEWCVVACAVIGTVVWAYG